MYTTREIELWLQRPPTNADAVILLVVGLCLFSIFLAARIPGGGRRYKRRRGCVACMKYKDARLGRPSARCANCGRNVLDVGQFFTPDREPPAGRPYG